MSIGGANICKHDEVSFLTYCEFVTIFPHLIAGPIINHRDMMPQFIAPKTFVAKQTMDLCLKNVETETAAIKESLAKIEKPLMEDVGQAAACWNTSLKEIEEEFKKQMELLASLGSELDYKDKFDNLDRKLASLKEEEEVCTGSRSTSLRETKQKVSFQNT